METTFVWAQEYIGSGRLTGQRFEEPTYTATGAVAPGWRYVGWMTDEDFDNLFEDEQAFYISTHT